MAGIPQFEKKVHGIEDMQRELQKMNADSKRNFGVALAAAVFSFLTLIVAIITLMVQ